MAVIGLTNKTNVIDYLLQLAHLVAKVILFNYPAVFILQNKKREPTNLIPVYFVAFILNLIFDYLNIA
jgi:hypothetical protein